MTTAAGGADGHGHAAPARPAAAPPVGSAGRAPGPLAGLRVLDLSRMLSGPYCTLVLSDLGAEVTKVEAPGRGDDARHVGPFVGGESTYFMSVNRNKRSVTLDLKDPECRRLAQALAARADVLVENFRPGTAARLGLGYPELEEANPRLIYCSISGFGQTGPYRDRAGYDAVAQAMSGIMSVTGEPGGPPARVGVSTADTGAGMWAVIGILAALQARARTGRGQLVDVSLLDGQVAWLTYLAGDYLATGAVPQRYGSAHPQIVPYQAFATADGHVIVAVGNDALWRRFAPVVGLGDLAADPRFATNPERVRHRADLLPLIEAALQQRTTAQWLAALEAAGVPAGPIQTLDQVFADPQVRAREMVVELDHPAAGRVRATGAPVKLSATPARPAAPPPRLGEHTDEVLAELGYTVGQVNALRTRGAV